MSTYHNITAASQLGSCPRPVQPCFLLAAGRAGFIQHKHFCVPPVQRSLQPPSLHPQYRAKTPSRLIIRPQLVLLNLTTKLPFMHRCPHRGFPPLLLCPCCSLSLKSPLPPSPALIFPSLQPATQFFSCDIYHRLTCVSVHFVSCSKP